MYDTANMRMLGMLQRKTSVLIACLLTAASAIAQTPTATLSGTVRDQSGLVMPTARITVRNTATAATRAAVSDEQGRYSLSALDAGVYQLRAEKTGFKTAVLDGLVVTVGGAGVADVVLMVGEVSDRILVQAETPLIEPQSLEISRVVGTR